MSASKVVRIDFFTADNLPPRLRDSATKQGVKLGTGLVAVKTRISSPPTYDFVPVGTKPEEIQEFMATLAKQDGADLGNAVQKAFREE